MGRIEHRFQKHIITPFGAQESVFSNTIDRPTRTFNEIITYFNYTEPSV